MKFTEKEIADLIDSEDGNPLAAVCTALLAALKETNAALAASSGRAPAAPVVNVAAAAAPDVKVTVPAPNVTVNQTRPRMRTVIRVTKFNREGMAEEMEATDFLIQ